jgi:hypothetical protein
MNQEEIDAFWAEVIALVETPPELKLEYRIHYNEVGEITLCTMSEHPDSDRYIVVTKLEYDNYFRYCVVNRQLKLIEQDARYSVKLVRSNLGHTVVKNHAGLILEADETYNDIEYYDHRNN